MSTTTDTSSSFSENSLNPVADSFFLPYGTAMVTFSILACLCGLPVAWVIFRARVAARNNVGREERTRLVLSYLCGGFVPLCVICVGCVLVAVYAALLVSITSIDYYGPMRMTQVGSDRSGPTEQSSTGRNHGDSVTASFDITPYLQVEYGYDWACGNANLGPDHYCPDAWAYVGDCAVEACRRTTRRDNLYAVTCTDEEFQTAKIAAESCVTQRYFNVSTPSDIPTYTFDPTIGPSRDNVTAGAPPTLVLYGDCNLCNADFTIASVDTAQNLRMAGGILCIVGLLLLCASVVTVLYRSKGKYGKEPFGLERPVMSGTTLGMTNHPPAVATAVSVP